MNREMFELTEDHVKLLRASWVNRELSGVEYGAAEIDPKRPYGNSAVEHDIAEILGMEILADEEGDYIPEATRTRCRELHEQTPTALQVVLSTGSFEPGVYRMVKSYRNQWVREEMKRR